MFFIGGMPGGMVVWGLLWVFGLLAVPAYVIYRHAKRNDDDHARAWGLGAFFAGIVGYGVGAIVVGALYYVIEVRD